MKYTYRIGDEVRTVELVPEGEGYQAFLDGEAYPVRVLDAGDGRLRLEIAGRILNAHWAAGEAARWISIDGQTYTLERPQQTDAEAAHGDAGQKALRAPMPGQVQEVRVAEGDEVEQGQTLVLLEAMKMVIRVRSDGPGRVARVPVERGDSVDRGQILVQLE